MYWFELRLNTVRKAEKHWIAILLYCYYCQYILMMLSHVKVLMRCQQLDLMSLRRWITVQLFDCYSKLKEIGLTWVFYLIQELFFSLLWISIESSKAPFSWISLFCIVALLLWSWLSLSGLMLMWTDLLWEKSKERENSRTEM